MFQTTENQFNQKLFPNFNEIQLKFRKEKKKSMLKTWEWVNFASQCLLYVAFEKKVNWVYQVNWVLKS